MSWHKPFTVASICRADLQGILTDEEYHAIAVYVFTMNERSLATVAPSLRKRLVNPSSPDKTGAMIFKATSRPNDFCRAR